MSFLAGRRILSGAFRVAAAHGDEYVGTHHLLIALLREPSTVADVLAEYGITPKRLERDLCGRPLAEPLRSVNGPNPDATSVLGRAQGLALAVDRAEPSAGDWIVAMLYSGDGSGFAWVMQHFAVSRPELADALRHRGVVLPHIPFPPYVSPSVRGR